MQSAKDQVIRTEASQTTSLMTLILQWVESSVGIGDRLLNKQRIDRKQRIRRSHVAETLEIRTLPTATLWNGSTGGSWFDSSKWDGGIPNANKDAVITERNAGVLTFSGRKAEAANLILGSDEEVGRVDFNLNWGAIDGRECRDRRANRLFCLRLRFCCLLYISLCCDPKRDDYCGGVCNGCRE